MEASAFEAPVGLARSRLSIGVPLLRLRSDEQLVALFRDGHDDAFRVIHDRYHKRLLAYMRQMLPRRPDAEDALQEVFMRAYFGLRAHDRKLSLRAWLFRVAHNRCIDELRRPAPPPPEILDLLRPTVQDPVAEAEQRESLRRLIADVRRLPDQQRSALLMRELGGMSYTDLAASLDVSVPAVKSLLVRARVSLVRAAEARDTACSDIREALVEAHDHGVRPAAMARRHMRDCTGCRSFRRELRGMSRGLAAIVPSGGPIAVVAKLLGGSGGAGGGASGGSAALGAVGAGGTASSAGIAIGANHVVALIAAAVATGSAMEIQRAIAPAAPGKLPGAAAKFSAPVVAVPVGPGGPVMVYTPSGQVVVVPAAVAAVPAAVAAPTAAGSAAHHAGKSSSGAGLGAVTNGSASAATAVDNPPGYGSSDSGTSSTGSSTSSGSTPPSDSGSVLGSGSGSSGTTSGSGSSDGSGSSTSGSTTTSLGSVTTGAGSGSGSGTVSSTGSSGSGSGSTSSGSSSPSATPSSASGSGTTSSGSGTSSGTSSSGSGTK